MVQSVFQIWLNDEHIADALSVGDASEAVGRITHERWHPFEPRSHAAATVRSAEGFREAGELLLEQRDDDGIIRFLPQGIVHCAFAVELYLKALGRCCGTRPHGHDLIALFEALPENALISLDQTLRGSSDCTLSEFRVALSEIRSAYHSWRYLDRHYSGSTRKEKGGAVAFEKLHWLLDTLHVTATSMISQRTERCPDAKLRFCVVSCEPDRPHIAVT